jgi:Na+/melibiose symporter-like transporter
VEQLLHLDRRHLDLAHRPHLLLHGDAGLSAGPSDLPFSLLAAGATLTILFASAWFTRDQIPRLPKPPADQPPFSPFEFLKDDGKVLANRNYVWLLAGLFALSLMNGIRDTLGLYGGTYYWGFPSEMLRWYSLGSLVGFVSALTLTPRLHARWGKRRVIIWSAAALVVFPALGFILREVGWMFPNGDPRLLPTLVAISAVSYAVGAILNISVMSALADVADENEVRFGVRREGVLNIFAVFLYARSSISKADPAATREKLRP